MDPGKLKPFIPKPFPPASLFLQCGLRVRKKPKKLITFNPCNLALDQLCVSLGNLSDGSHKKALRTWPILLLGGVQA